MATLRLLYFARVREAIGLDGETIALPAGAPTVADMIDLLAARGGGHAGAFADRARIRAALDDAFVGPDAPIGSARELALFPPVTGGAPLIDVRVQADDIDVGDALGALEALGGGGVASFTGVVRGGGGLSALVLEHHPTMTMKAMRAIVDEACSRWRLLGVVAVHRVGALAPGARIVLVAAASPHRAAALEATAFLIDWLKTKAPFWKQERFDGAPARWVEARGDDDEAAARWG